MTNFPRENFQGTYYDISVTTYQKMEGKVRSAGFGGLKSIYEELNFYEVFKLLLTFDIF